MIRYLAATALLFCALCASAGEQAADAELPKVLLIGDSISIGYTPFVKKALEGKALVRHHKGNAGPTIYGLQKIEQWLGDTQWDVIHFNFGLWDLYGWEYVEEDRSTDMYRERLLKLVKRLKATGAKLIWATTTPVCPEPEKGMRDRWHTEVVITPEIEAKYRNTALEVMNESNIEINDLYLFIKPDLKKYALGADDVHYSKDGYEVLGVRVAESIMRTL